LRSTGWGHNAGWRTKQHQAKGEFVFGVHCVRAALLARKREFYRLLLQRDLATGAEEIETMARANMIPVDRFSKHDLNMMVQNRPHNGVILDASPLPLRTANIDQLLNYPQSTVWIALDEVQDPQNFGSIVRSALYFGADGVIVCDKNSAPLSPVTSKASSGAIELLPILRCDSTPRFLKNLRDLRNGNQRIWRVIGLDVNEQAQDCRLIEPNTQPTLLVIGNEGSGLRYSVKQQCDFFVKIQGRCPSEFPMVDSLNVANATTVALYQLKR